MSQDRLIKLVSKGDENGVGKGHVYYTVFNNKNKKDPGAKHTERKFNPVSKSHTDYVQKK
jgi:ribosomal protein L33